MSASKVEIRPLKVHVDARGAVFEPLEPALLSGWRNVHTVISEPGAIRGNHRHLRGTEEHDPGNPDAERVELIS
jgi:dTDP-4-dehydrorhamnose 3,5-epimerase-like enzyme